MEHHTIKLGRHRHYKGNKYEVIGVEKHSETLEDIVLYRACYGAFDMWARPIGEFCGDVEAGGKRVARFEYIGE